ncbi:MAG TPA: hypothetical protein VL094_01385, partial [Sphingomonadaceae bacterium]|nr:hypothetical protein [Sphingomonadaceae bacterium]
MFKRALAAAALALLAACSQQAENGAIDEQRLLAAEDDPDNWLSYGRTYAEQRYSPLEDVNDSNVGKLGLA